MNTNLIYALFDPRNDVVVYVGKTTIGNDRPITHLHHSHNAKVNTWIADLNAFGLSPIIKIIETNLDLNILADREKYWINEYYNINQNIFNLQSLEEPVLFNSNIDYNIVTTVKDFLKDISKFVKSVRYLTKMTQEEFSKYLDINRSTLSVIENTGQISIDTLNKILDLVNDYKLGKFVPKSKSKLRLI